MVLGIGGLWFNAFNGIICSLFILSAIILYGISIKRAFNVLLNGGEDRLLELLEKNEKSKEFQSLNSIYSFTKDISIRLPDEIKDYKLSKLHKKEKEILEKKMSQTAN